MEEERICHICGKKMKDRDVCKKCKADPAERIISDCRAALYANKYITTANVNLVLTDRRLLAFEDIKGSILAGVSAGAGAGSGLIGAVIETATDTLVGGNPTERPIAKGINGSLKYEAPLSSLTGIEDEPGKWGNFTLIHGPGKKPLRVILGLSFDTKITDYMFKNTLVSMINK